MKKIKFISFEDRVAQTEPSPVPSKSVVPKWYKKTPNFNSIQGKTNSTVDFAKNQATPDGFHATYKMCIPFVDAMTSGYSILLPVTVIVIQVDGSPQLRWNTPAVVADLQNPMVMENFPVPHGHSKNLFRWINNWKIETPVGYSLLVTHPVFRHDLPFTTLTGFVDTDKHINPLLLPFFIQDGFEGEIPMGTPIAQVFPIKRDDWESSVEQKDNNHGSFVVKQMFLKTYKYLYWTRKSYN